VAEKSQDETKPENSPETTPKRRLRVGSTETVRERTEKLQIQAAKPKEKGPIRSFVGGFFAPLRWLGRQIGKLGRFRVFRWISYVFVPPYIRNSWRELRLVTWPNRRQSWQLVNAVIIFSVVFGIIIAVVDYGLDKLFKEFIIK
jgi:preprotein translocase SecE subunit